MPDGQPITDAIRPSRQEMIVTNCWSSLDGLLPDFDESRLEVIGV